MILSLFLAAIAITAVISVTLARRPIRTLTDTVRELVRDPARRLSEATEDTEANELRKWINALAEDANRSHQALHHERTLLASVADGLTQGLIAIDADRRIELLNEAAQRMLDVQGSLVGEPLLEFVRVPELRNLIEQPGDATAEVQIPNGPRTLIRATRTWGRSGRVLLLEDVTNVRKLESVRRDFVANVSHELRTPIAVIRANAETLLAGAKSDPHIADKLLEGLHRNAERLARMVTDLLDLSRLDAGQYRLDVGPVAVRAIADQSLSAVEPQAHQRNVKIHIDIADALAVQADPKALDQILVNLIDNAVKYTHAQGNVWVGAHGVQGAVRVEVRDDGPGIATKHRDRIFERFYRADQGRSREAGGTGLGLSIVKHLVESMNGEVGIEPNTPQGSIFWLQLPTAATTAIARTAE